jgi:hypothetical protein
MKSLHTKLINWLRKLGHQQEQGGPVYLRALGSLFVAS